MNTALKFYKWCVAVPRSQYSPDKGTKTMNTTLENVQKSINSINWVFMWFGPQEQSFFMEIKFQILSVVFRW